jgi:anti-sigma regulatory factor (Ser/Thr protein kinase)
VCGRRLRGRGTSDGNPDDGRARGQGTGGWEELLDDQSGEADRSFAARASSGRAPPLTWELSALPPVPASVAAARRQAHDVLDIWARRGHLREDDALLMLDELAANTVRHAHTPFTISLSLDREALRGAVLDLNPRPPVLRIPTLEDLGGRGIQMVAVLADRWGVDRHDGDGKTVWFEIDTKP